MIGNSDEQESAAMWIRNPENRMNEKQRILYFFLVLLYSFLAATLEGTILRILKKASKFKRVVGKQMTRVDKRPGRIAEAFKFMFVGSNTLQNQIKVMERSTSNQYMTMLIIMRSTQGAFANAVRMHRALLLADPQGSPYD